MITPSQTLTIINKLTSPLHFTLVLTCAATALRASEIVSLRWSDILWTDGQIRVSKRWAKGKDGETKTEASNGYVPMHSVLAQYLNGWRTQSPYSKIDDFVFPSLIKNGKVPISDIRTTMNLYTQDDRDEKQAAQGAVRLGSRLVQ